MTYQVLGADPDFLTSPDCIHESLRFAEPTPRKFLRLTVSPKLPTTV